MTEFPLEICYPCVTCRKWTRHRLVGFHEGNPPAYLIYECENCGRQNLVPIGAVWMFTNFSRCGEPIV